MKKTLCLIALVCAATIATFAQVPVSLAPVGRAQFFSASGAPLAGGLVYTTISGTSIPLATYVDASGLIQATNPIVLDSSGEASIWLQSSGTYRIRVTDQFGSQQWVVDGITGPPNLLAPGPIGTSVPSIVESTAFTSATAIPALSGIVRLASGDGICWRNNANSGDVCLTKNASDTLLFNGGNIPFSTTPNEWTMAQTFDVTAIFNQATGAPPFTVASSTNVPNLNASLLLGFNWASPGNIGTMTPGTAAFTTLVLGTSLVLNGSQALTGVQGSVATKLELAGTNSNVTGAPLCNDANGAATTSCTPQINGPFNRSTTILNATVNNTDVSVIATTVAIPATGGPFRILGQPGVILASGASLNGVDCWLSDGSNTWDAQELVFSTGANGNSWSYSRSALSSTTYAAGAGTITVTAICHDTHTGSTLTAGAAVLGPGVTELSAEAVVSN